MKVLVVDPDLRRAPALKETLTAGGAEVTVASSGSFALTMLEWNRHDVVVSRARIDDMHGHELCAILKSDPGTRDVRFVLVAAADEVTAADTAAAGVDLVLPPGMMRGAILPLVVRLVEANRSPAVEPAPVRPAPRPTAPAPVIAPPPAPPLAPARPMAPAAPVAREATPTTPASLVPRIRPEPLPPPQAEPPKRYATAITAGPEEPWATTSRPAPTAQRGARAPASPLAQRPGSAPVPVSRLAAVPPSRPAAAPPARLPVPPVPDLSSMPSGTFQGSLEVMELADLTQAIGAGGKTGRLILALPQGGGLMLFEKGRVVHAEYREAVGEEAFGALLAACHANGAGRFCFLPSPAGETTGLPRTIDKAVDQLLLSSATAIDEKG
jgi:CheY-like chemotaxis protein